MKIEISEQVLLNTSKKHLSRDYDEENGNFMWSFGQSLIPENFTLSSRLKDDRYMEPVSECLQYNSKPSTNAFNDADTLRRVSNVRSVLPTSMLLCTSLKKLQESNINTESGEINIPTNKMTNICPETTASEHTGIPMSVTTDGQEFVEEEDVASTLKELRNSSMDIYSARSSRMIPIKSILRMSSERNKLRKKVQFSAEWPRVLALEHRLLIDDLSST
ncbi:unnamed protein product [Litomosoides sigmodontis]|uniref:Uncharacterized protein n=1 Tax=Litomosoides sigmodontis TaxID=42156 RepID=A0A3P6TAK7_LITSI|nr:unnamed protein product [Litomosoides sigmodontis]VDK79129.1 unnamed protein product [Litomosoides sigmodontis]